MCVTNQAVIAGEGPTSQLVSCLLVPPPASRLLPGAAGEAPILYATPHLAIATL